MERFGDSQEGLDFSNVVINLLGAIWVHVPSDNLILSEASNGALKNPFNVGDG